MILVFFTSFVSQTNLYTHHSNIYPRSATQIIPVFQIQLRVRLTHTFSNESIFCHFNKPFSLIFDCRSCQHICSPMKLQLLWLLLYFNKWLQLSWQKSTLINWLLKENFTTLIITCSNTRMYVIMKSTFTNDISSRDSATLIISVFRYSIVE